MHDKLGITFIYVTHDQEEALTMSDTIVVMKDGNVIELGNHETLMVKHGFYYNLYSVQFRK